MSVGQGHSGHGHIAPPSTYYKVFGALNNVVMLLIACTKATLVILFFMHVRWGSRLTWVVAMAGFFWLLLLFSVMGDYMSRGWVP